MKALPIAVNLAYLECQIEDAGAVDRAFRSALALARELGQIDREILLWSLWGGQRTRQGRLEEAGQYRRMALDAGADAYLVKTNYSPEILLATLRRFLE